MIRNSFGGKEIFYPVSSALAFLRSRYLITNHLYANAHSSIGLPGLLYSFASGNIMEKSDGTKGRVKKGKKERNESVDVCFTTRVSTFSN